MPRRVRILQTPQRLLKVLRLRVWGAPARVMHRGPHVQVRSSYPPKGLRYDVELGVAERQNVETLIKL
jgi:hypothetical protein